MVVQSEEEKLEDPVREFQLTWGVLKSPVMIRSQSVGSVFNVKRMSLRQ